MDNLGCPGGHRYDARPDYDDICARYGAESYTDFTHDDLETVAAETGYHAVATIAQHELADRWNVDTPHVLEPLGVATVAGSGSGITFGVWGITIDTTGPGDRSPIAATYHETGHKLDERIGQDRDDRYPATYGDLIMTEMRATLAMSRFEDRVPAALDRVARTVQERQELYRIKKGGGAPLYGPEPADMSVLEERAEDWGAFLREANLLGHQIGYPLRRTPSIRGMMRRNWSGPQQMNSLTPLIQNLLCSSPGTTTRLSSMFPLMTCCEPVSLRDVTQ